MINELVTTITKRGLRLDRKCSKDLIETERKLETAVNEELICSE